MVMIPMSAFTLPDSGFLTFMDWTTRLFWTSDMCWSVLTAVVLPDGKVNFSFKFILRRYLKTWFGLDCLIVSSDWMEVIISSTNIIGLGKLARGFRLARVVRLLRLVRMQEVLQSVTERIQSDKLAFTLSVTKLMVFILATAHVIACLWWAVGDSGGAGVSWINEKGAYTSELDLQYLLSLHWSLSQFTGGMDEVAPMNTIERFYAVLSWIFGFMGAAVITSIMTSNLTHLHIIGGAQARQMSTLRKYLKQNHISRNLALRMQRSAQHAVTGDLAADSVELLALVAEPLRVEMNFEMYSAILRNHPLFADWIYEDPQVIRRVCHIAVSTSLLAKGDVIFSKGETPRDPKMYFVIKGLLEYYCRGDSATVGERQWVAEGSLWTAWTHRGTLTATTDVKMAVLDSNAFRELVHRFKGKKSFDPRLYASEFVDHINKVSKEDDLTFMS
uniref:Cyclic nucleotide-binding domain-containing protein n=1 Tax=Alexandrium catenella TaxID=2925 RepID=A0A7S1L1E2_ALECA